MRALVVALAVSVAMAGCAQVPSSGPVVEVDQALPEVASSSFVRALARPPRDGMSQVEVVQGFLDAASGFEDGHAVARMYLTARAAQSWDPEAGVRVYGNDTDTLANTTDRQVIFSAAQVAVISARSQYIPAEPETALSAAFELVQQGNEWRIDGVPQGLLLSRAAVERSYREFQTYYIAAPGGILAPNPVLFTSSQRDVTPDLVSALLAGPGSWLGPAVLSGFPAGTRLNSVTTTDGVIAVDLSSEAAGADDVARQQLSAQLVWTLRQVPGMRAVVVTVDGQPFPVPGIDPVQPRTAWAEFDPDGLPADAPWYLTRAGAVMTMTPANTFEPVPGAAGVGVPRVRNPLVSLDRTVVAATDARPALLTAQTQTGARWREAPTAGTSAGGSWDRTGLLWLPDPQAGVQVVTVLGSKKVPIDLTQVRSVQISRDGSRAVVVAGSAAYLMRVDREGSPPRLDRPRLLMAGPVRAVAWSSATQVTLLVKQPDQPAQVATLDLGLLALRFLGGPPRARSVAAAPDRPLLSGTADGQVWQFNGAAWVPLAPGRQPRYPG